MPLDDTSRTEGELARLQESRLILSKMEHLLRSRARWIQGNRYGIVSRFGGLIKHPAFCLAGAFDMAKGRAAGLGTKGSPAEPVYSTKGSPAETVLHSATVKRGYTSLMRFNDSSGTKYEDVRSLLTEAIAMIDAKIDAMV